MSPVSGRAVSSPMRLRVRSPIASVQTHRGRARHRRSTHESSAVARDVLTNVQRLHRLADDLLLLARLDSRPPKLDPAVDVGQLACPGGATVLVSGDEAALSRMLEDLTSNAARYATHVEVHARRRRWRRMITVDDEGRASTPADRARVVDALGAARRRPKQ